MLTFRPDIVIRNHGGRPIAVVEVKNRQNLSRDIATELRRNMVAHGLLPQIPYFLLLSQDKGFLWKGTREDNIDAPPTYEFLMDKVVTRYLKTTPQQRLLGAE